MKLIIIYGPPAVGKLTVAKELSKIIDYKILHNHMTIDLITPFIKFGEKDFLDQVRKIRLQLIELAGINKVDLIYTSCYKKGDTETFFNKVLNKIKKHNGEVLFVQLTVDKKVLQKRVQSKSRANHGKASSVEALDKHLKGGDYFSSVPHKKNLKIDNTNINAKETAKTIKEHYKLK